MKTASSKLTVLAGALLALAVASTALADHGGKDQAQLTRLRAKLAGQAIQSIMPEGNADFRSESGRMRLQVEVERVNLPAGTVLTVNIQSGANAPMMVGQITLSASGFGELDLDSQNGAAAPAVQSGDIVSIANAGTAIMAGVFGPA